MENISSEDQETIREFLVESHENLSRLDQDLVELEKHPGDADLLGSIFRTIHTIKGACGFLAFSVLEAITHQAETLLSQLRDGQRELTPALVSLVLETVDATRKVLASIEISGKEGSERFEDLTDRLRVEAQLTSGQEIRSASDPSGAVLPPALELDPLREKSSSELHEDGAPEKEEERGRKKEGGKEEDLARPSAAVDSNIRVGVGLLDKLMDLVGELVLTRNQILQFNVEREDPALNATSQRLNLITTELQEGVMKTRMQPIGVVCLDQSPQLNSCRPAVDALFASVAELYGGAVLAVILTGMGQDGLRGVEMLKARGARVLVQDEASSVVWGMPGAVANAGLADRVLPLDEIVPAILGITGRN